MRRRIRSSCWHHSPQPLVQCAAAVICEGWKDSWDKAQQGLVLWWLCATPTSQQKQDSFLDWLLGMKFAAWKKKSWQSSSSDMDMWQKPYKNEGCLLVLNRWIGSPLLRTGLAKLVSAPAKTTHAPQDEMDESELMAGKLLSESLTLRCSSWLQLRHPWNRVSWTCLCCPDGFSPQKLVQSAAGAANEGWKDSWQRHGWDDATEGSMWRSEAEQGSMSKSLDNSPVNPPGVTVQEAEITVPLQAAYSGPDVQTCFSGACGAPAKRRTQHMSARVRQQHTGPCWISIGRLSCDTAIMNCWISVCVRAMKCEKVAG